MLTDSQVQGLVSAMAGFSAQAMSESASGDNWRGIQAVALAASALA
jgi:hypothetical protein